MSGLSDIFLRRIADSLKTLNLMVAILAVHFLIGYERIWHIVVYFVKIAWGCV